MRIVGIVGAEAAKFTPAGQAQARAIIRELLAPPDAVVSSGHCPIGGIDIWAEEEAQALGRFDPAYIFAPQSNQWEPHGFKERNLQIAHASAIVHCIAVDRLPADFKGRTFPTCYHCAKLKKEYPPHVKSGGCWTMIKCAQWQLHVVKNYPEVTFD